MITKMIQDWLFRRSAYKMLAKSKAGLLLSSPIWKLTPRAADYVYEDDSLNSRELYQMRNKIDGALSSKIPVLTFKSIHRTFFFQLNPDGAAMFFAIHYDRQEKACLSEPKFTHTFTSGKATHLHAALMKYTKKYLPHYWLEINGVGAHIEDLLEIK